MKITITDPVYSFLSGDFSKAFPLFEYTKETRVPATLDGKEISRATAIALQKSSNGKAKLLSKKKLISQNMINEKGILYTGFIPRLIKAFPDIEVEQFGDRIPSICSPSLKGIILRQDQTHLLNSAIDTGRGVVLSPTGSGKTVVAGSFISCYTNSKVLFLCHSLSIINQTKSEFKKFGFKKVGVLGGGSTCTWEDRIILSTIQSFIKLNPKEYKDKFDIVIVDECHHINNEKSQYAKVLKNLFAPRRLGFTATLPSTKYSKLVLEGLIGPVIGELTVEEGIKMEILAKPIIKMIPVNYSNFIGELKLYKDIYREGVVQNKTRNRFILIKAIDKIRRENKSVLIMVKEIAHGEVLVEMAKELFDYDLTFVRGSTDGKTREEVRTALDEKGIKGVIATAVWREGINVRSLDTIINACGGRSEIMTIQAIGRGLRLADGKTEVEIIDFLDRYKYLAQHCVERMSIYADKRWL